MTSTKMKRGGSGAGHPRPPQFSEDGNGPRVLVEHPDPVTLDATRRILAEAGYDVATCPGPRAGTPTTTGGPGCPLLQGATCSAVTAADVIVTGLSLGQADESLVVCRLRAAAQDTPIVLECPRPSAETHAEITQGMQRVFPLTFESLLRSVRAACDSRPEGESR